MRLLIFIVFLIFFAGCGGTKNATTAPTKMQATWLPVSEEMAGQALPPSYYAHQKLVIGDSTYDEYAESVDKGIVKYCVDNRLDIYGKEGVNAGKHFTAIYKFENGQLIVCYNLKGDGYPGTFDTKGKPLYFLAVFTRLPQVRLQKGY